MKPAPSPAAEQVRDRGERLLYPDLLRSISIYLVVLVHTVSQVATDRFMIDAPIWQFCNVLGLVGRVAVPLFFMISGYFLLSDPRTADPLPFYRRRFCRLLIPFLFWDVVCFVVRGLLDEGRGFAPELFFTELVQRGSDYQLWFVYQMAAIYLLAPFLRMVAERASRKSLWILMGVALLVPTVLRLVNILQSALWFSPFSSPIEGYVGYFLLGYLLGTREYGPRARRIVYVLALLALVGAALGNRYYSSVQKLNLYFNEGYALNRYLMAAAVFLLTRAVSPRLGKIWEAPARTVAGLAYGMFFCHVPLMRFFSKYVPLWGVRDKSFLYLFCIFVLTAVSSTLTAWIFSRVPVLKKLI